MHQTKCMRQFQSSVDNQIRSLYLDNANNKIPHIVIGLSKFYIGEIKENIIFLSGFSLETTQDKRVLTQYAKYKLGEILRR